MESWLMDFLPASGDCAVDVGANHGTWTRELAGRFRTVYAVEPNPALTPTLQAIGDNVVVMPIGAWEHTGWQEFGLYADDQHSSAVDYEGGSNARKPHDHVRWWCERLDDMDIWQNVDFLKIDVEAAEVEVLRGARETLFWDTPRIIVEVHTEENGHAVENILRGHGYKTTAIHSPVLPADSDLWRINYWIVGEQP